MSTAEMCHFLHEQIVYIINHIEYIIYNYMIIWLWVKALVPSSSHQNMVVTNVHPKKKRGKSCPMTLPHAPIWCFLFSIRHKRLHHFRQTGFIDRQFIALVPGFSHYLL